MTTTFAGPGFGLSSLWNCHDSLTYECGISTSSCKIVDRFSIAHTPACLNSRVSPITDETLFIVLHCYTEWDFATIPVISEHSRKNGEVCNCVSRFSSSNHLRSTITESQCGNPMKITSFLSSISEIYDAKPFLTNELAKFVSTNVMQTCRS
ncbi:hypothetical protein Pan54_27360 [Rubinisphaera italica]|uniref:Uncharacterized protein n=1 Tax=Rubinisphaera italica TaxID=2527969 RepID=A0A5C5XG33_9PLAN|nr:hypothetical protein Pan54_27360 [Rubinisphaera italica]